MCEPPHVREMMDIISTSQARRDAKTIMTSECIQVHPSLSLQRMFQDWNDDNASNVRVFSQSVPYLRSQHPSRLRPPSWHPCLYLLWLPLACVFLLFESLCLACTLGILIDCLCWLLGIITTLYCNNRKNEPMSSHCIALLQYSLPVCQSYACRKRRKT